MDPSAVASRGASRASGIASSCRTTRSRGWGSAVQTAVVWCRCDSICSTATRSYSSVIAPDEDDIGSTSDVDNPWETNSSLVVCNLVGTGKCTLRDSKGVTTWDSTVKFGRSAKRYAVTGERVRPTTREERLQTNGGTHPLTVDGAHQIRVDPH
jgi:hypothetical protein